MNLLGSKPDFRFSHKHEEARLFLVSEETIKLKYQELILNLNVVRRNNLDGFINVKEYKRGFKVYVYRGLGFNVEFKLDFKLGSLVS